MRATVGILTILGLSVAVAAAQGPGTSPAPQRRAVLLPPIPLPEAELPFVARAAAEELPSEPAMTPVVRPTRPVAGGPGWLHGTDPHIRQAAGTGTSSGMVRNAASTVPNPKDEPSMFSKGLDKLKSAFSTRPEPQGRAPGGLPPGVAGVSANASTPFRGTAANGAPVYAGPPAYRWYGWGSVTPGANPHAPAGQYPPASANWFAITGATPGAFPVPVTNPGRMGPGTEPPVYVTIPNQRMVPSPQLPPVSRAPVGSGMIVESSSLPKPPVDLSRIDPPAERRSAPTPTISVPPTIGPAPAPVMAPVTTAEPPIRPATNSQPLPQGPEPTATKPVPPVVVEPRTTPEPLPVSVSEQKPDWQPKSESTAPGEWGPLGGKAPPTLPTLPAPPAAKWREPGASRPVEGRPVARGQAEDSRPDPAVTLIRTICADRAASVDVRWTGSKRIAVSLTCRDAATARRLMSAISARPELAPLEIDFSVRVK